MWFIFLKPPSPDDSKRYRNWWVGFFVAPSFLLIIVIIVLTILLSTIGSNDTHPPALESVYNNAKELLQNTVNDYQDRNEGALPAIKGTITINNSTYSIIDICLLLVQNEESLQTVLDALWSGNGSNDDNCDGGCTECKVYHSYIWAVDDEGNVHSSCIGEHCNASGIDGYQDAWP